MRCLIYRLYEQGARHEAIHLFTEPVRTVSEAVSYLTVGRLSNYLKVPKIVSPLNSRVLDTLEYIPIDVNLYMDGLDTMAKYRHTYLSVYYISFYFIRCIYLLHFRYPFINNMKEGLSNPFQLWSWLKGNGS
jgi:hypothetical protein